MSAKTVSYNTQAKPHAGKKTKENATLTILNGCFSGLGITIKKAKTVLGSDLSCDVCLDDSLVSSEHAVIRKTDKDYTLEDLSSQNGTHLNGKRINQAKLHKGDMITIGDFEIKFS